MKSEIKLKSEKYNLVNINKMSNFTEDNSDNSHEDDNNDLHKDNADFKDSVFILINRLCKSILLQYNQHANENISKLRAIAYEILLKKKPLCFTNKSKTKILSHFRFDEGNDEKNNNKSCEINKNNLSLYDFEPERALDVQLFVARLSCTVASTHGLHGNDINEIRSVIGNYEELQNIIQTETYFQTTIGRQILQFLFLLQRNVVDTLDLSLCNNAPALLVPGAFTLHSEYSNNQYYPDVTVCDDYLKPSPKYFNSMKSYDASNNPYIYQIRHDGEKNFLNQMKEKYLENSDKDKNDNSNEDQCTFTGLAKNLMSNSLRINCDSYRLFPSEVKSSLSTDNLGSIKYKALPPVEYKSSIYLENEDINSNDRLINDLSESNTTINNVPSWVTVDNDLDINDKSIKRCLAWNWESLGCLGMLHLKPFAGESHVSLLLQSCINQMKNTTFHVKIVSIETFLNDLKYLTVGIQSDIFKFDESSMSFHMKNNITIDGFLPETILNFVNEFLECGTCYKRLQNMISKTNYLLRFEGFMFKTLCKSVDEYLFTFRQYVFGLNDNHLMEFYSRMKSMMRQVSNLSYTLAVHPNVNSQMKPPQGSKFLGYLYRELTRLTERDYISLMLFILRRCCHVYLKYLQKWIYNGILDDPSNELFIGYIDQYRKDTKHYYDKAYFIRKESVPGFFQGFEDEILQCGKYTMLLKAYKPNHPIFGLEYPSISVCLSFDEIQKLETVCQQYLETARNNMQCSPMINMRQIFEEREERKREFFRRVSEKSQANLEHWKNEQRELALNVAIEKRKRLDQLLNHLNDVKRRKKIERKVNVELELDHLKYLQKLEMEKYRVENINLRKRIEYYQELCESIQNERAQEHLKQIHEKDFHCLSAKPKLITSKLSDKNLLTTKSNQTRLNTDGTITTDYQSCFEHDDDDEGDEHSEYEECLSVDFVEKFAETANVLEGITAKKELNNNSCEDINVGDNINKKFQDLPSEGNFNQMTTTPRLQRSFSDVLNCNELSETVAAETPSSTVPNLYSALDKNRRKNLTGNAVSECLNEQIKQINKIDIKSIKKKVDQSQHKNIVKKVISPISYDVVTEAQRNRLKILSKNFSFYNNEIDVNCNSNIESPIKLTTVEKEKKYTDLDRNRTRMLYQNQFTENKLVSCTESDPLYLNFNNERAINRQKVLESQYNIVSGRTYLEEKNLKEKKALESTAITISDYSTMPTVSSTTITISTHSKLTIPLLINTENGTAETLNGIPTPMSTSSDDLLPLTDDTDFNNDEQNLILSKTSDNPTNVDNNNDDENDMKSIEMENIIPNNEEIIETEKSNKILKYDIENDLKSYQRTIELLDSNFKCDSNCPFIRLNKNCTTLITTEKRKNNLQERLNLTLNGISVITLTEFLRKSILIPLRAHLELVNNEVMHMLLIELQLFEHFRSLRNYFLLMHGEFGAIICDGIIGKLESGATPANLLNYQMLHSILDTALNNSILCYDKNVENLSFVVSSVPDNFDLQSPHVLDVLTLSYQVKWPLNLLLNPETLEQYSIIFRYLIRVRRISWILERAYELLKQTVKRFGNEVLKSPQYRHIQLIRHKLHQFVYALQHHITSNALQASWKTFKDEFIKAKSMEDLYRKHANYIKRIMFLCMLNRRSIEFHNTIESVFKISLHFYYTLKSRDFKLQLDQHPYYTHSRYTKLVRDEKELDKFIRYTIYLGNKIVRHGYQAEIGEFIHLINFNQYYKEQ